MANTQKVAGVDSYLIYGEEAVAYGTAAATIATPFGIVESFKVSQKNNLIKKRGFANSTTGGRDLSYVAGGKYEASLSVDITPLNFSFLKYVLGSVSGSGTSGAPYVYVGANTVTSITVANNINNDTTDREELYLGCVVDKCTIKSAVGEPVTVSLDFVASGIDKDATLTSNVANVSLDPFTFAGGSIEIPNATALSNIIDSVEITINNNASIIYGLGAREGKHYNMKEREYSIKFTVKYLDETLINKFLGSATGPISTTPAADATIAVRFDDTATHYVDFIFSNGYIEDMGENFNLNEMITEDITYVAKTLSVTEVVSA